MNSKLNYATREPSRARLLPAVILSFAGSAIASPLAGVIGFAAGLGWPLSRENFRDACVLGLIGGFYGGIAVALLATTVRAHRLLVSLAGLLATSICIGMGVFYFVRYIASA